MLMYALATIQSKEYLDILSKVDQLYSSAWARISLLITIVFASIALGAPLITYFFQIRPSQKERKRIIEMEEELNKTKESQRIIGQGLVQTMEQVADLFLQQGVYYDNQKLFYLAFSSFKVSILDYFLLSNLPRLKIAMNMMAVGLRNITPEDYETLLKTRNVDWIFDFMKNVESKFGINEFKEQTDSLKTVLDELKQKYSSQKQ